MALIVLVALAAITCSNSSSGPPASGARLASPSQAAGPTADSKAADLRARLDGLLGEQVVTIVKSSLAASANRADEYKGYATLLTTNGSDLSGVLASAFGASAAATFDQVWAAQSNYFVDYTVGIVSHNAAMSNGAASGLVNGYVPKFAQYLNSMTSIPLEPITQLLTEQVLETKAIIDDEAALSNPKMFADLHLAYAQASRVGDAVASAIARKFPDKFPGDPASKAVDFRVALDNLLQEHSYLATMATSAIAAGRSSEQAAALNSLAANADAAARQGAHDSLTNAFVTQFSSLVHDSTDLPEAEISSAVQSQVTDTIKVIDDQRSKAASVVAADDHTAAAATYPIADVIATAAEAKLPAKFCRRPRVFDAAREVLTPPDSAIRALMVTCWTRIQPIGLTWSCLTTDVVLICRGGDPGSVPAKPRVPPALRTGPFTSAEARAVGVTRGQLRGARYRRLGSGLYRWVGLKESPQVMLTAVARRLPAGAAFSGPTAAWLHGLDVAPCDPIEVTIPEPMGSGRRAGACVRRAALASGEIVLRRGLPTTSALRTVVDLGGRDPLTEGVVAADLFLHAGLVTIAELRTHVAEHPGVKGIARVRRVVELAQPKAESAMETRLRMLLVLAGLPPPEAQVSIHDDQGRFLGRPDLLYRLHGLAIF